MSFTSNTSNQALVLAQNFNIGSTGQGGVDDVVGALDNLAIVLITIGGAIAVVAFLIAILRVIMTVRSGGGFGQAFSSVGTVLLYSLLLGVGSALVGWIIGIGSSLVA